jgi:hypothetical protein
MNISGKVHGELSVTFSKTPEYDQEVKVEDCVIWVKARRDDDTRTWTRADALRSPKQAKEEIFAELLRWLWRLGINDLQLTKAEMKRRILREGLISK